MLKKTWLSLKIMGISMLSSCYGTVKSNPNEGNSESGKPTSSIYDFKCTALDGTEINFSKYKGKKLLIVNVASECGHTHQYEKLQKLHTKYGDKITIIGFPANNFGGQEPGSDTEIASFCKKNYGVTFQMMSKISVKGDDIAPIYKWLSDKGLNGWNDKAPTWNFCKYLINEEGEIINFFSSSIDPLGKEILDAISK